MVYAVGVDVGGTKIAAGIVDLETGHLFLRREVQTCLVGGGEAALHDVVSLLNEIAVVAQQSNIEVEAVGLGICEIVDSAGRLRSGSLIDWRGIASLSTPEGFPPVHLVSDVRAAALAEYKFGSCRGASDAIYVSVGTGISSVLLMNGRPYSGANGAALVLSSAAVITMEDGTSTILEEVASGPGLARLFGVPSGDSKVVIAAALNGDRRALDVIAMSVSVLGAAIAQLVNCLDPAVVAIGGGLGSAPGPFFAELRSSIEEGLWKGIRRQIDVRQASLGSSSGLIGAALAASVGQR